MIPFLDSMSMFSLMYNEYEKHLKEEIWRCHKYMELPLEEIMRMPRMDRKMYIRIHNKLNEEEKARMK